MDSLHQALQITRLAEGTTHSEELSKQYLDTVKKDTQIEEINSKLKRDKSQTKGRGNKHHSNSGKREQKGNWQLRV